MNIGICEDVYDAAQEVARAHDELKKVRVIRERRDSIEEAEEKYEALERYSSAMRKLKDLLNANGGYTE